MNALDIRVYYEDTDHGGVVYHANYLKFMERARTEFLRQRDFSQSNLAAEHDVLFALTRSDVRYILPATFDDLLTINTQLISAKGARMHFKQQVIRPHIGKNTDTAPALLVEADIHLACMSKAGKAKRIPPHIIAAIVAQT